ncbi:hypothetical protein AX15_004868 [Amanita polypyramis BW_CC]|nr:hypothetical protein AX15_004868 [Amanita polypyramis BW_CC]
MAHTRTFCCCIPVRLGVFILTILNLVMGLLIAVVGWTQVAQSRKTPLSTEDEIALVLNAGMFSVLAAISLLGLIGAVIKQRSLISTFGMMLLVYLCISIGTGIYAMYSMFRNNGQAIVQACLDGSSSLSGDDCKATARIFEALVIVIYIIVWLLQLWGFIIVINYCHQLDDEEEELLKPRIETSLGKQITTYDSFGLGAPPTLLRTGVSVPSPGTRWPNRSEV